MSVMKAYPDFSIKIWLGSLRSKSKSMRTLAKKPLVFCIVQSSKAKGVPILLAIEKIAFGCQ